MATLNPDLVALCPDTNADAVREIIDTELTDAQINAFLNTAYFVALPLSGGLDACGGTDMQCDIIKYLAAHGITLNERQVKSQSVGGEWSVAYLGKDDLGLDASLYGQQAKAMDCSGYLPTLGLKGAKFEVATYEAIEDLGTE